MMRGREATEYPTCSPTVPGGDTPCLTAGDARRVNPWSGDAAPPPTPAVSHSIHFCPPELLPPRFQCDAAGVGVSSVHFPTGSLSLIALVSPSVMHGAPPPEALSVQAAAVVRAWLSVSTDKYIDIS